MRLHKVHRLQSTYPQHSVVNIRYTTLTEYIHEHCIDFLVNSAQYDFSEIDLLARTTVTINQHKLASLPHFAHFVSPLNIVVILNSPTVSDCPDLLGVTSAALSKATFAQPKVVAL